MLCYNLSVHAAWKSSINRLILILPMYMLLMRRSVTESNLILPEDGHIDLEILVREYMLLEIPISPLCSPDCKGLVPFAVRN